MSWDVIDHDCSQRALFLSLTTSNLDHWQQQRFQWKQLIQTHHRYFETRMALPQSRAFITSLIETLNQPPSTTTTPPTSNPLKQASPADRSVLLTLHVLFPNELLPALDLLDRELVVRLVASSGPHVPPPDKEAAQDTNMEQDTSTTLEDQNTDIGNTKHGDGNAVYYVRSAQHITSNSRFRDPVASTSHYEVRTLSWNCSCPAFTFSAFPAQPLDREEEEDGNAVIDEEEGGEWMVGGLSLGQGVPMCKHLLACVLAERGGLFGSYVKTREVSVEELAGWAAGWGDWRVERWAEDVGSYTKSQDRVSW
jgi:hypothetical protein